MKHLHTALRGAMLLALLIISGFRSGASHIVGFDFGYTHISGNTYKITMIAYGDCGPASATAFSTLPFATPHICIYDGDTYVDSTSLQPDTANSNIELTLLWSDTIATQCSSTSSYIPGIKKFTYTTTYTLPYASAKWRFLYNGDNGPASASGRVAAFTNISSGSLVQLVDTLNNLTAPNSSPQLSVIPAPFFCINSTCFNTPGAIDPEGDSLVFTLVPGMNGSGGTSCTVGGPVTYLPPAIATSPIHTVTDSFSFDPTTGQLYFIPDITQRSLVVYNIEEYRAGVLVGTSQREMTIFTITCTDPPPVARFGSSTAGTLTNGGTDLELCANTGNFTLTLQPTENDTSKNIKVNATFLPPGATFTTVNDSTNHPLCTFNWTTASAATNRYIFYVTYTDDKYPVNSQQTIAYSILIQTGGSCGNITAVNNVLPDNQTFAVYPNPSNGTFTVQLKEVNGDAEMTVTDIVGKVVASKTLSAAETQADLHYLPDGTYIVKVVNDGVTCRQKIVVAH